MTAMTGLDLRPEAETLAAAGGRAPSLHNAQPWAFRVGRDTVEVHLDPGRLLPVADATGRQARLGLGAAVFLLRLALADRGWVTRTELMPDPAVPLLAARLTVVGSCAPTAEQRRLIAAAPGRRTVRTPFVQGGVPAPEQVRWSGHAEAERAGLRWVEAAGERLGVAALVTAADRRQQRDPAYLAELAHWTDPVLVADGLGVPPSAFGVTATAGHAAEFPMRDFAGGRETDRQRHVGPAEAHPVVAVLVTGDDRPEDWLRGGQALARVLLAAAADGYAASYLNQPVEQPVARQLLRDELRLTGWPQAVLRLGHPVSTALPSTPRRPAADTLLSTSDSSRADAGRRADLAVTYAGMPSRLSVYRHSV
jgi:nitroreductase